MSVMTTTDDVGGAGQRRQDAEGRRRAEQKLHECVLEMMELPETAVLQETGTLPKRRPGMDIEQHRADLSRARHEWEARLEMAMKARPQNMPALVFELADTRTVRARGRMRKSVRKTASRVDKRTAVDDTTAA